MKPGLKVQFLLGPAHPSFLISCEQLLPFPSCPRVWPQGRQLAAKWDMAKGPPRAVSGAPHYCQGWGLKGRLQLVGMENSPCSLRGVTLQRARLTPQEALCTPNGSPSPWHRHSKEADLTPSRPGCCLEPKALYDCGILGASSGLWVRLSLQEQWDQSHYCPLGVVLDSSLQTCG